MDELRQQRIKELYQAALTCSPADRTHFLLDLCHGDEALRREVESRLELPANGATTMHLPLDGLREQPSPAPPALTSWGNFRLIERLGAGGFGEVYQAWDPALEREVALKLLLPSTVSSQGDTKAVLREARLLARVRHPNVVSVYGVDQHGGRVGFWSDLVRGKTLSQLLDVQGSFGARETALLGIELARGISAVHAAGLLHRDIKTGNVMREEGGRILLMDFGLSQERGEGPQVSGGTLPYMAPELLAGQPASVATDLYAFGVLLYHLLTGRYPYDGVNIWQLREAHRSGERRRLMDERADLPASLVRVIETATETEPSRRYASAGEMIAALSDTLGVVSTSTASLVQTPTRPRRPAAIAWLVVPVLGTAAAALYLIPAVRAVLPGGREVSLTAASAHTDYLKAQDLLDRYYLPQSLPQAISLFKKSAAADPEFALAHAGLSRAYLQQYWDDHDAGLIAAAQNESLAALRRDHNLASAHVTLGMIYTQSGKYDLATQELDEALKLDSGNAEAYGALGELYTRQGRKGEVEATYQKAADLAPRDWRWPNLLGLYYLSAGQTDKAAERFRHCIRLTPDNARAYNNLGIAYRRLNRISEARAAYETSIRLEPTFSRLANLGRLQQDEGKLAEAIETYQRAIAMNAQSYRTWSNLASAYSRMPEGQAQAREMYRKAISVAETALKETPKDAAILSELGSFYAAVGDADNSIPALRQAAALAPDNPDVLYRVGEGYELLHRREEALRWIKSALAAGCPVQTVERNPELASLRADPRFSRSVAKRDTLP